MSGKLTVNRLNRDELTYELQVRGASCSGTVTSMRRTLSKLLKLERSEKWEWPKHPFTFEDDAKYLEAKITEINTLIDSFVGDLVSVEFLKINCKLLHAIGCVNRSMPADDDQRVSQSKLLVTLVELSAKLDSKAKRLGRSGSANASILNISQIQTGPGAVSSADDESISDSDESIIVTRGGGYGNQVKPVPVMHWNLKYSGDHKTLTLNAFLERVEELRVARNVHKELLFSSALDLFSGRALVWYRAVRRSLSDWDELVVALREEFQSPSYDEELFDEIRRRTQGPNESISMYIALMTNLFERLTIAIPENNRLRIILRNLSPFYQSQLGLVEIRTVEELKSMGKRLEIRRACVEAYVPPPRRNQSLEPDLACSTPYMGTAVASASDSRTNNVKCWNCGHLGHISINCRQPHTLHCYKCGHPGVTVRKCPKCNLNSNRVR